MSDSPKDDAAGLALAARLRTLRDAGVVVARFAPDGSLTFVRFGILDGGMPDEEQGEPKPNPLRDAALRLSRSPAPAES